MGCINRNEIARRAKRKFPNLDENYNSSTKADYTFDKYNTFVKSNWPDREWD